MEANEYQHLAKVTANIDSPKEMRNCNWSMGLAGEAGEVVDYLKKVIHHGHVLEDDVIKKELGDVCWYVAVLAYEHGIPLSEILEANIAKLKKRYPEGFTKAASRNRASEK